MRALISVSDKTGIVDVAKQLVELGVEIISTGGTYKKLKEEGLFDKEKKTISRTPKSLGIITSKSGAAIKDLIHTITSRWKCDIYIFPCQVQKYPFAFRILLCLELYHASLHCFP